MLPVSMSDYCFKLGSTTCTMGTTGDIDCRATDGSYVEATGNHLIRWVYWPNTEAITSDAHRCWLTGTGGNQHEVDDYRRDPGTGDRCWPSYIYVYDSAGNLKYFDVLDDCHA